MKVTRIVSNIQTNNVAAARSFYQDILGLDVLMDMGWIVTYGTATEAKLQLSIAIQGGAGTVVPDLSIEVDNVDEAYQKMKDAGFVIEYDIVNEPWGVRRFYVRDPLGKLINILSHLV